MRPFAAIKQIATLANVVRGLGTLVVATLSVWAALEAMADEFPTAHVIFIGTVTAMAGLLVVYFALIVYEKVSVLITSRVDQARISGLLENLGNDVSEIDLMTAAGIWAGTLAPENIERHSYFRGLKAAVRSDDLVVTYRPGPGTRDRGLYTRVDLNSLKDYWRRRKVIR